LNWPLLVVAGALAALSGCGVFTVPREASEAAAQWRDEREETDPCRFDAMEHCVGGSGAAAACGRSCAILLGRLLELYQRDGNAMDLFNNAAGAGCALPIGTSSDGAVACCEALLNSTPSGLVTDGPCR